jgi:hypothetical protein
MNTEERLGKLEAVVTRLAERTDAIAQSVELLAGMQRAAETRTAALQESMTRLVSVVLRHEERLDDMEGNRQ